MGSGLIISETIPDIDNRYTWLKPLPDGSREWYEPTDGGWTLVKTDPAPAEADHTHPNLDELADIVALLSSGVTGTKTIAGHQVTFNHGILVDYQAP